MTDWLTDLAKGPPPPMVKIGEIAKGAPFRVSWDNCEPQEPLWSDAFDQVLTGRGLTALAGLKVLILLPDQQPPFVSALVMGGPTDATT